MEGAERALEPPLPAVRAGECPRRLGVAGGELRERPQPLSLGRCVLERPRQRRERPPARPAAHVVGVEERLHVVPERARLARAAVVVGRLAHEIEPLRGARARRVEEVAVVLDRIRPLEPRASLVERAPRVVVEERRAAATARQAPLLQPEDEDGVEAARAGAQEVDHRDAPGVVAGAASQRGTLDRREHVLAAQLSAELAPALELGEQPPQRLVCAEVEPARGVRGRMLEAVCVAEHPLRELPHRLDRIGRIPQLRERGHRRAAQALRTPRRRARAPGWPGPEAGPRRSRPPAARPPRTASGESEKRSPRVPPAHAKRSSAASACTSGVCVRRSSPSTAYGMPNEPSTVSSAPRIRSYPGTTSPIRSGGMPPRASASTSSPTSSSVPRLPAPSKKRITPSSGGASPGSSAKSAPLEMRQRRRRHRLVARRQLLDGAGSEAGEILGRAPQRREHRPSRLVGKRNGDLGARGQRLEQRPLSAGQILEAVREDRLRRARRRGRYGGARQRGCAAGRGPSARAGRARSGSPRRETRARLPPRPARGAPRRARRAPARASRRSRYARRSGRSRRAVAPPTTRRTRSACSTRPSCRRASGEPTARRRNRSSKVPIEPPRSAGLLASSSSSTRLTSATFGTMSTGSAPSGDSSAAR